MRGSDQEYAVFYRHFDLPASFPVIALLGDRWVSYPEPIRRIHFHNCLEIGYLFQKFHWHKGYAAEAAVACKEYAFSVLGAERVCSIVRNTNIPAQNVALRNGMIMTDRDIKNFRGVDMEFILFTAERQ